ncbi:GNAT family N-acetyltransferase [Paenibacillus roseipurpureus]|uniref:GNAT family N-acetyltransferase n=1 Tax=Paenibacillus roseopurpureus TaxID=2918901 RepID=A0AA96LR46_9BACL|nr:GNAT family N-acetyltransferase [Paenibacillus sp. MBLB1832]WNR44514.1 GNAT family N-acetyltransferase [Paenibacillus sp. MBLB1832]
MSIAELFTTFPYIRTERLFLRQIVSEDAEDLYRYYTNPLVTKHLDWLGPSSIEDSMALINGWHQAFHARKLLPWGISYGPTAQSEILGTIMIMPTRGNFEDTPLFPLSVGYELKAEHWNKGIMSEALQAVLDFTRTHVGARRIQAEVYPENAASLRLLKKLGFQEEGLLRQYMMHEVTKKLLDVIMLALLC